MSEPLFRRYQAEFCAHVRDPKARPRPRGVAAKRIGIYAELLFNNMESTLARCFPVCKQVLGVRRWRTLVRAFLAGHRCTTPLLRQIPREFLDWLQESPGLDLPPYLPQLAHYEWVELALAVADAEPPRYASNGDLLDGVPVLAPALLLLRYDWPVQRISPRFKPDIPLMQPVWLLVFRDAGDEICFIELNAVSARLIELLQPASQTGRTALRQVAEEMRHPDAEQVMAFGLALLQDLHVRGAILGTAM